MGAKLTLTNFIKRSTKIHNKYDYSKSIYVHSHIEILIICPIHGVFSQKPKYHLLGKGCPKCVGKGKNNNDFIENSIAIHGLLYDYSLVKYENAKSKVSIVCKKHGIFTQSPNSHLGGKGCPVCNMSKGERAIEAFLIKKNIFYEKQKSFNGCKYKRPLLFDFYLPDYNICVEFHGDQHYRAFRYFGGEDKLIKTKLRDNIKQKYCLENNIRLLVLNNIKTIILELEMIID